MYVPLLSLSICYLFILLIQTVTSGTPCVYDVGKGQQIDIRSFGLANGKGPKYNNIPTIDIFKRTYNWNGCFPYSKSDGGDCIDAAACFTDINTGKSTRIAKQSDAVFESHDTVNLLVYHSSTELVTVFLTCRDSDEETITARQDDIETFNIYIQSRCCCPNKCHYSDGSLTGGAIFIIILVVVLFVYIVGGIIFLKFIRGATGSDLIPNRIIWLHITSHAIDGLRYCIQVIRHRSFQVDYQKI